MIVSIPKPCHEKWENFTPTDTGGFCSSCKKEVIDFTTWSSEEIHAYLIKRPNGSCGRFLASQLKYYPSPLLIKVPSPFKWLMPSLVGVSLTLAPAQANAQRLVETASQTDSISSRNQRETPRQTVPKSEPIEIKGKVVDEENLPLPA
jgi:hypothetical protein